jgi:hypothetical protein
MIQSMSNWSLRTGRSCVRLLAGWGYNVSRRALGLREKAEKAALRALPWHVRLRANTLAALVVCVIAAIVVVIALGSVPPRLLGIE